jgi:DNA invertase Pin-like site-specific DNA recombinase
MIIGYARVSTTAQNLDLQRDALKRAGCERIIEDTVAGATCDAPAWGECTTRSDLETCSRYGGLTGWGGRSSISSS